MNLPMLDNEYMPANPKEDMHGGYQADNDDNHDSDHDIDIDIDNTYSNNDIESLMIDNSLRGLKFPHSHTGSMPHVTIPQQSSSFNTNTNTSTTFFEKNFTSCEAFNKSRKGYAPTRSELFQHQKEQLDTLKHKQAEELKKTEELIKIAEVKTPPKRIGHVNRNTYYVYDDIIIGNGDSYIINKCDITPVQLAQMKYPAYRKIIQIFIELRNSMGYTSDPPHKYDMNDLNNAIILLQKEYIEKYKFRFGYDYNVFKVTPDKAHAKTFNELHNERKSNIGFANVIPAINFPLPPDYYPQSPPPPPPPPPPPYYTNPAASRIPIAQISKSTEPFLQQRFGPKSAAEQLSYNPLPQRQKEQRDKRKSRHEYIELDDLKNLEDIEVTSMSRLYSNREVQRRKKKKIIPYIHNCPF